MARRFWTQFERSWFRKYGNLDMPKPTVEVKEENGVTVATIRGYWTRGVSFRLKTEADDELQNLSGSLWGPILLLDLSKVGLVDSWGAAKFADCMEALSNRGGESAWVCSPDRVPELDMVNFELESRNITVVMATSINLAMCALKR